MSLRNKAPTEQKFNYLVVEMRGERKMFADRFPCVEFESTNWDYIKNYLKASRPSKLYVQFEPLRVES